MFCAPGLVFGDTEGVPSHFHVFRSQTCFRRSRGRRVSFSCFALRDMFSAVPRASGPVFMFCASGQVFGDTEGLGSRFDVLDADLFSAEPKASAPIFMFCVPGLISRGTEGVGSRFQVLISQTHFHRYRGRRVPFSCLARQDSFSAEPRASSPFS
jgi:hypothetical protein